MLMYSSLLFRSVHPENQTKVSFTQDLKWSLEQSSALQVSFSTASNWFIKQYKVITHPARGRMSFGKNIAAEMS